ncbi:helix-turn-helix domain-containing protein [Vibrio parahaemolyticus]|uniref:helix-turn-helix domain-containing protein n=1 Tax=Vibrio parahaemolyticus TaxID=670 RepID=UPI001FAB74E5|nr:helix-turn-helix domain-containing protein [Vibrio parahaemolyticus]MCI9689786.1 hypothetical protein [Vibrio parahaemolyticus]
MPVEELKPEHKMLLMFLLKITDSEGSFSVSIGKLASDFGAKTQTVSSFLQSLKTWGYLSVEREYQKHGTGLRRFTFTDRGWNFAYQDQLVNWALSCEQPAVVNILKNNTQDALENNGTRRCTFRSPHRLLLLLLLKHMDELGAVEISTSELCEQMGISRDRFKSVIRKLKELGFFKAIVNGHSSKLLFGRSRSRYYFDLSHKLFERNDDLASLVVNLRGEFEWYGYTESTALLDMKNLFDWKSITGREEAIKMAEDKQEKSKHQIELQKAQFELGKLVFPSHTQTMANWIGFTRLRLFFTDVRLHDQLQLWFYDIASELMSSHWDNFGNLSKNEKVKGLLSWEYVFPKSKQLAPSEYELADSLCRNVLTNPKKLPNIEQLAELPESLRDYRDLIQLVLNVATTIARRYKSFLRLAFGHQFSPTKVLIIPGQSYGKETSSFEVHYVWSRFHRDSELLISNMDPVHGSGIQKRNEGEANFTDIAFEGWESVIDKILRGAREFDPKKDKPTKTSM